MNRREVVRTTAFSLASLATIAVKAKTPAQIEGPFHPMNIDSDLRRVKNSGPLAAGQQIQIRGFVINDKTKKPIEGVLIEIWQADCNGKYNHPNDPLDITPDPNFQFYGRTFSKADGSYQFLSIKPGSYPADESWDRPPHVHFRVLKRGYLDLTTQMYFAGESLNEYDKILQRLPKNEQKKLVINFEKKEGSSILQGCFNIELEPV